jgi:hypothetical protein
MSKVALTVIRKPYHGIPVGGVFYASRNSARALIAIKRAEYATAVPIVVEPALPVETANMESEPEISPRTGKPKRQYRRRDMSAEN